MKNICKLSVLVMLTLLSCNPKEKLLDATVTVKISHSANGKPIVLDDALNYTNGMGQSFSVSMLKYYIGKIQLINDDGSVYTMPEYKLINCDLGDKTAVDLAKVPNGTYNKLKFCVGVDATSNATATIGGDLDVSQGMFWEMVGYTFFKHEGKYKTTAGDVQPLVLHYGRNEGYIQEVIINFATPLFVEGGAKIVEADFALDKVYDNTYDFNMYNFQMSATTAEIPWILKTKSGLAAAFTFKGIK
jgi:hypothetical protein